MAFNLARTPGSPAHAGIDPSWTPTPASRAWLPRTRGDRPACALPGGASPTAPPHTRGSTRAHRERARGEQGSPAHAGIDPRCSSSTSPSSWLPRTRGDRPKRSRVASENIKAPPHTRGSTPAIVTGDLAVYGSPAHAGIDPVATTRFPSDPRLPRTRGDRPKEVVRRPAVDAAPPHTRGSTRHDHGAGRPARGSPAHAGIDPAMRPPSPPCARLPRTRGDRPTRRRPVYAG